MRPSGDAEIGSENRIGPLKLDETTLVSQINKYTRKSEKLEMLEGGGGGVRGGGNKNYFPAVV